MSVRSTAFSKASVLQALALLLAKRARRSRPSGRPWRQRAPLAASHSKRMAAIAAARQQSSGPTISLPIVNAALADRAAFIELGVSAVPPAHALCSSSRRTSSRFCAILKALISLRLLPCSSLLAVHHVDRQRGSPCNLSSLPQKTATPPPLCAALAPDFQGGAPLQTTLILEHFDPSLLSLLVRLPVLSSLSLLHPLSLLLF